MVKIRSALRDYFAIGKVEEGFLVYKHNKEELRLSLNDDKFFYTCMAVKWIDVDEKTGSLCTVNYDSTSGFDPKKFSHLYERCLMKPAVQSTQEKLILAAIIGVGILALAGAFLGYMNYGTMKVISAQLPGIAESVKSAVATVVATPTP